MKNLIALFLFPIYLLSQNVSPSDYTIKSLTVDNTKESYFQFSSGTSSSIDQSGWDLAFYNEVHEIGGKINELKGVKAWRINKDTINFNTLSLSDTLFPVYNNDSFMYLGALDTIYTGRTDVFFSIGVGKLFSGASYFVAPDKMYIIRKSDGGFGKFFVRSYSSTNDIFVIQYANIDNTDTKTISIGKIKPLAQNYQFVNLTTGTISKSFEPASFNDWDIVLRNYTKVAGATRTNFPVGIMTNNAYNLIRYSKSLNSFVEPLPDFYLNTAIVSTEAYEAIGDPLTITYNSSLNTFNPISRLQNQIAANWYNPITTLPKPNISYFLRDRVGKIWHIIFKNFNITTNTVEIAYKNVANYASVHNFDASDMFFRLEKKNNGLKIENLTNEKNNSIEIYDISGKLLVKSNFSTVFDVDNLNGWSKLILVKVYNNHHQNTFKVLF